MKKHELKAFERIQLAQEYMNQCEQSGKEVMSFSHTTTSDGFTVFVVWTRETIKTTNSVTWNPLRYI